MTPSPWAAHPVKRVIDMLLAIVSILVTAPLMLLGVLAVFAGDFRNPMYVSERIGRGGRPFRLFKIRTMVVDAASSGVDTTASGDPRITRVGQWLRRTKIDELPQFFNVLLGDMSLIGPRPNVRRECERYTPLERHMLDVRPGLTDYASIVFADLAEAVPPGIDPNLAYNQYVRPLKSRLALHYVRTASLASDAALFLLTLRNALSRERTMASVLRWLQRTGADADLIERSSRDRPLTPWAPPGADRAVSAADLDPLRTRAVESIQS